MLYAPILNFLKLILTSDRKFNIPAHNMKNLEI